MCATSKPLSETRQESVQLLTIPLESVNSSLETATNVPSSPDNTTLRTFSGFFLESQQPSRNKQFAILSIKTIATACSFASQYPSAKAAMIVSNNPAISALFGVGEALAWGSVYAVASTGVIDDILINRELQILNKNSSHAINTAYWLGIILLSISVQTSDVYISYVYTDHSLAWPIFVGSIFATFTLHSLHGAIEKIARTNNIITRCLYRNTNTTQLFKSKDNFCNLLEDYFSEFLAHSSELEKKFFFELVSGCFEDQQRANLFLWMLVKGLDQKIQELDTQKVYLKYAGRIIKLLGPLLYIGNYYLDTKIVYKSSKLIIDNDWFAGFLIFISITPNIPLDLTMSTNTLNNLFWGAVNLVNRFATGRFRDLANKESLMRGAGYAMSGLLTYLGLGSTMTIIDDNIGFEDNRVVSVAILSFTALLVVDGVLDLSSRAINRLLLWQASTNQKKLALSLERVQLLAGKMRLLSTEQFDVFMSSIAQEIEPANSAALIEQLATESKFKALRDQILSIFIKESESDESKDSAITDNYRS